MDFGGTYGGIAVVSFNKMSSKDEPMGEYNSQPVFVDKEHKTEVSIGDTFECKLFWNSNCYFAIPDRKIEKPIVKKETIPSKDVDITDTDEQGILDIIMFNELSKQKNPMGRYHNLSVFPQDQFTKNVALGEAYYCRLTKQPNQMLYKAVPLKKITLDDILDVNQEYLERLVSMVYSQDPTRFDQLITAQQLLEHEATVAKQYKDEINTLKKENEKLHTLLENGVSTPAPVIKNKESTSTLEGIHDGIFYSDKLEDRYYSARINFRGDVIMLVKDENGEYSGLGNSIDIAPFKKLLNSENIKGMYCEKYGGVVFIKEE